MPRTLTTLAAVGFLWWGAACAPPDDAVTDTGRPEDARAEDVATEADAEAEAGCTSSSQCDDGIACTQDVCRAGGACGHTALDALCAAGERCVEAVGCTSSDCTGDEQCSDGVFCNGDEMCIAGDCFDDPAGRVCDDGNVCTADSCDAALDHCVYDWVPGEGCETDGGDSSTTFDPLVHYSGEFYFAPGQSQSCPGVTYSVDSISFVRTDPQLEVWGAPCAMRQAPPPDGATFSVTCTQGCGTYSLSGTFSDSNNFAGRWTATFPGCPSCSSQDVAVVGARM
ncbi:MAG: hypothetical protein HY907_04040 [Deltaproteobacteria bacterium]|nr:hypothetical protein [Deltaproteobacteria bacterium]